MKDVYILGISAYYHDSAAAIIRNGEIIAAASEERFTRIKGDSSFPHNAVGFCLEQTGQSIDDLDYIIFYEDSILKFDRILTMSHITAPVGISSFLAAMPKWMTKKFGLIKLLQKNFTLKNQF